MSKELADRLEKVASDLLRDGMLDNAESKIIDEAIAALRAEPASGQLSAEQIEKWRSAVKRQWPGVTEINALCDMALSSLRGTFAERGYGCWLFREKRSSVAPK